MMLRRAEWPAGWTYEAEDDRDDDVVKITHWLIGPDGARHLVDVSPYDRNVSLQALAMLIDMGVPGRAEFGVNYPISPAMIEARWRFWRRLTQQAVAA